MNEQLTQNIKLTHQDSLSLDLIKDDNVDAGSHLYDVISELQISKASLEQENEQLSNRNSNLHLAIWISVIISVVAIGVLVYLFFRRRTERFKMLRYEKIAQRAQQTLSEREKFLAYTNHEIRTPLNAVSGSAELLQKTKLNEQQTKYVNTIKASVDNVLILVNDVLDLSRIESGNIEFIETDFVLTDILNSLKYILQEKVEKKGIEFELDVDAKIPPILRGDARYLNQILINLCNNAIKFTDFGKVTLLAYLDDIQGNKMILRFDIIDTGKGIRKSKLATIFNQFEQETRHTIKHQGGSGLGLSITKQLVESMGGKINVHSKYLEGTTFSVRLQFLKGQTEIKKSVSINYSVLDDMRILVVDDNLLNREIITDLIKSFERPVVIETAESGEQAFNMVTNDDSFSLVLMDIQMPGMDGYETTRHIRRSDGAGAQVPIIAMTAFAMDDVAKACFEAGMNDFITKPVDANILVNKIQRIIEKTKNKSTTLFFDHVDLSNLKRLTGGDNTKMFKYIDLFLQNVPLDLNSMRLLMDEDNLEEAIKMLHKIKGNTAYMGNSEIGEIYDNLVENSSKLDKNKIIEDLNRAATLVEKCISEISNVKKNYKLLFLELK